MLNKKSVILGCCLLGWGHLAWSQKTVDAAGGNAFGVGGNASYSVGQIDYQRSSGTGGVATQGVQQPFEIFTVGISEAAASLNVLLFPNPAADYLILQIGTVNVEDFNYELIDVLGKSIQAGRITGPSTTIPVSGLSSGQYFIRLLKENEVLQSFQVIKK
jgi:hypothetical protein